MPAAIPVPDLAESEPQQMGEAASGLARLLLLGDSMLRHNPQTAAAYSAGIGPISARRSC